MSNCEETARHSHILASMRASYTGPATQGGPGGHGPPTFLQILKLFESFFCSFILTPHTLPPQIKIGVAGPAIEWREQGL